MEPSEVQRVERIEHTLFGDGSHDGVLAQMAELKSEMTHLNRSVDGINANMAWIVRLLIAGIVTALLALVLKPSESGDKNGNHISIGSTAVESLEAKASDHRDWLTVQEVATREGVTDRTILNYIESRRISPTPTKDGREWRIAENFRILPNSAEEVGIAETQHIATP